MIGFLVQTYELLNKNLFDGDLPSIEFSLSLTKKNIFCFVSPNLEIGAKFITSSPSEIMDDLLHNMVHIFNHKIDKRDVTPNQYHNIVFCNKALDVGFNVECHKTRGWGITYTDSDSDKNRGKVRYPAEEAVLRRVAAYDQVDFPVEDLASYQRELQTIAENNPPIKQFSFKYTCTCSPPVIIRIGKRPNDDNPVLITCGYCDTKFVLDDSRPDW